jgi:hypothetical protein
MQRRTALTILSAAAVGLIVSARASADPTPDSQIPIHGTVVSVDKTNYTVILRYAPPGSQPETKHEFALENKNDVFRLHPGAVIDGTADTTQKQWVLSNLNIESEKPMSGQPSP